MGRPEEALLRPGVQALHDLLEEEAFPGGSDLGVPGEVVFGFDPQEGMEEAGVLDEDLGGPYLAFRDVGVPGRKLAQDESVRQEIEIAAGAALPDAEGTGDLRAVPGLGVVVGHHRPEAAQGLGRGADSELGEVAFQEGLEERAAPFEALRLAGGEKRPRKSAAQPEAIQRGRPDLVESEAVEPVVADPAGERFGALAQEVWRCAAQDEELRVGIRPVDQDPKEGEAQDGAGSRRG